MGYTVFGTAGYMVGSALTGVFFYLRVFNLKEEFRQHPGEDLLTYFWNAIVLKLWTAIFLFWMLIMDSILLFGGLIEI